MNCLHCGKELTLREQGALYCFSCLSSYEYLYDYRSIRLLWVQAYYDDFDRGGVM